jgi:PAS domain S-box-containing protein
MNAEERQFEIARSLFREANDAFFLFDPVTRIVVDLNPAAQRLTGLEKYLARTMSLGDLFFSRGPGDLDRLAMALNRTGFFHSREGYYLRRASGAALPVNISVSRIHTEPEPVGLVVARDISDRKRALEALEQAEARYNSLVESTGVVVWELDGKGVMVSLSPAFETITGWPRADWIGRRFDALIHPDDLESALRLHARAMQGETLPRFELRILSRTGNPQVSEFLLVTKIVEDSQEWLLGISRDITEQKRNEKMLEQAESMRQARDAAEQASRAKSDFLSNVSHEIRTPLSALLGFNELLADHPFLRQGPSEIEEYLCKMREHGQLLLALVDDLLDVARIEAGKLRLEREPCSLPQIFADVVESLRTGAEAKQLKLESVLAGGTPELIATDRLRLQQILVNLIGNAIKFTDRGGIRLTGHITPRPGAEVALVIEIDDTGIGMTSEEMSDLFQPFYRVRPALRDGPRGTGLGLAICQRLARQLGGDVTVRSTPSVGSTFTLTVPVGLPAPAEAAQTQPPGKPQEPPSSRETTSTVPRLNARLLLAEDHDANRQVITMRLSSIGAEVVPARNGKEALERIRDAAEQGRPFDAVIMDMEMPVLDGYEAVRQLRAGGFKGPILAVTAYAMSKDRDECLRMGCDDHISKPIEWDRFFRKLFQLLAAQNGAPGVPGSTISRGE